jgi:DNA-binding ferritin-like protein
MYTMTKTQSNRNTKRKTLRRSKVLKKTQIVRVFLKMINVVKLYHWNTHSYSEHKATDELYSRLNENIDKFVEVYLGKDGSRIQKWNQNQNIKIPQLKKSTLKSHVIEFRDLLARMNQIFDQEKDSDLLSIRDDILADINQFLYLLTLH